MIGDWFSLSQSCVTSSCSIEHDSIGIFFYCIGNSQWCMYNTQSKSAWLLNTQSIVLQADWLIMVNNERQLWKLTCPIKNEHRYRASERVSQNASYWSYQTRHKTRFWLSISWNTIKNCIVGIWIACTNNNVSEILFYGNYVSSLAVMSIWIDITVFGWVAWVEY